MGQGDEPRSFRSGIGWATGGVSSQGETPLASRRKFPNGNYVSFMATRLNYLGIRCVPLAASDDALFSIRNEKTDAYWLA
jgi:hypothetical protein